MSAGNSAINVNQGGKGSKGGIGSGIILRYYCVVLCKHYISI